MKLRGEFVERSLAHCCETGAMRRCTLRGTKNILKRQLIHVGAFNISLVLRKMLGAGAPRELKSCELNLILRLFARLISLCGTGRRLTACNDEVFPQRDGSCVEPLCC